MSKIHKMAAGGHLGGLKFTFDSNSGHFRSMQNYLFYWRPFWMSENNFWSHFRSIRDFFVCWQNGRRRPFWMGRQCQLSNSSEIFGWVMHVSSCEERSLNPSKVIVLTTLNMHTFLKQKMWPLSPYYHTYFILFRVPPSSELPSACFLLNMFTRNISDLKLRFEISRNLRKFVFKTHSASLRVCLWYLRTGAFHGDDWFLKVACSAWDSTVCRHDMTHHTLTDKRDDISRASNGFSVFHIPPGKVIRLEPSTVFTSNKCFVLGVILFPMIAILSVMLIYDEIK